MKTYTPEDIADKFYESDLFVEKRDADHISLHPIDIHLFCYFNLHKWKYFPMAASFYIVFPEMQFVSRRCINCGIMQCTENDGRPTWKQRL